ncbi:LysR family transcriptional regulator [Paraburkholderia sp. BR10923]
MAFSRQVASLEEWLGVPLFMRTERHADCQLGVDGEFAFGQHPRRGDS